jgi:hypothetical protein
MVAEGGSGGEGIPRTPPAGNTREKHPCEKQQKVAGTRRHERVDECTPLPEAGERQAGEGVGSVPPSAQVTLGAAKAPKAGVRCQRLGVGGAHNVLLMHDAYKAIPCFSDIPVSYFV